MKQFNGTQYISAGAFALIVFILCAPGYAPAQQITESLNSKTSSQHSFLHNADLFAGGFAQFTNPSTSPDGQNQQSASFSPGMLFRFHKSYRWWQGYDVNYGYTPYTANYFFIERMTSHSKGISIPIANVQSRANEFTVAYRIQGHPFHKLIPYAEGGIGETVFVPTSRYATMSGLRPQPGTEVSTQHLLTGVYDVGLDAPHLITDHMGARFEYRNLVYNSPTFHNGALRIDNFLMITQQAVGGMYFKF